MKDRKACFWLSFALLWLLSGGLLAAYPKTTQALQERYADEVVAHQKYGAYAEQALSEGYPAIAHLFRTLAASEAIHAQNFGRILQEIGQAPRQPEVHFEVGATRENLHQAATVEAQEIDTGYPEILANIRDEGHQEAIRFISYAWEAEKQHRDLILQIKKAASWFFGLLVRRIEGDPTRYYVCQVCGATTTELPEGQCPICDHPPADYREVPGFAPAAVDEEEPSMPFVH
jgi:rubrerythrin